MTQEEKIIRTHDSGRCPFKVPEGYFEGFTERMMNRLADDGTQLAAQTETPALEYSEEDINAILDYELVDNQHIAYYLTEAY